MTESLIKAGACDGTGANRPQMLAVYESAMDANQAVKKKNIAGQMSLFDMMGDDDPLAASGMSLPQLPDCPVRVKLQMEKEASGVYMTGHPLDTAGSLEGLSETEDHGMSQDGRQVEMGGILTEVKGKATKKGDYMAFVTLEDLTGQVEGLVFPRVYEKYQPLLQEDAIVVLGGKLSVREEESPKLLVDRVARIAPTVMDTRTDAQIASAASRKLFLRLDRSRMDSASAVLALHAGEIPVYLHVPDERMTVLAPRTSWCDGSEACLNGLKGLIGPENVVLK